MTKGKIIGTAILYMVLTVNHLFSQTTSFFSDYRFNTISTDEGLLQSSVLCMVQDHNGFIWMGTKYGINRYDGYKLNSFKYNPEDTNSLSANEIIKLLIDHNGDILVGTRGGGLSKYIYNKNVFTRIREIPGNVSVNAIYEDTNNNLYIGTTSGFYKGYLDSISGEYSFENLSKNSIYNNSAHQLISTNKRMVSVVSVLMESPTQFILGTEDGLFRFNPQSRIFTEIDLYKVRNTKITSILKNKQNKYFIGSSEGLAIIDSSNHTGNFTTYYDILQPKNRKLDVNWVNQIILDNDGNLWGGTRGGGLFRINSNGELKVFSSNSTIGYIRDNVINSLLIDNTGVLWLGTESRGCNTVDLYRKKFKHIEVNYNSGKSNLEHQVTAITGDGKNTVWIGTAFNGINKLTKKPGGIYEYEANESFNSLVNMPTNEIISLYADNEENLWVGMAVNNLIRIHQNKKVDIIPTGGFVFSIFEDNYHDIWYGTWGNGFGKVNISDNSTLKFSSGDNNYQSLSNDIVLCMAEDDEDNLWVGTKGGGINIAPISILNQGQSNFVNYVYNPDDSLSISNNDINCIFRSQKGDFWVGTSNGLNKVIIPKNSGDQAVLQGKIKFEAYYESDGLPNNVVYGILDDAEGNLWISTLNGLSKFDPVEKKFTNFTSTDGLQANEFHANGYYKASNKELYFGGVNGVTQFNPEEIKPNPYLSKVVITSLKVYDEDVRPNQKVRDRVILTEDITNTHHITLSPKHKEFSLEFSAMHFSNTANVKYAYRLVGFNDEWRIIGNNLHSASYTNIYEGNYIFQVKATNNDGVWNDNYAQLSITILPPFWRKPIFFVFYFLTILILLFFFRKYSLIAITEKNKLKIEALERKKIVEMTESKMRFFTNISHEIRTPLTLIYSPLERIINQANLDEETRTSINLIRKNVVRLLTLTNQLLQLRKIDIGLLEPGFEKVKIIPYVQDILEYFGHQTKRKAINIVFNPDENLANEVIWIDKEMITTALYNLLSNAFKYSKNKGKIIVSLTVTDNKTVTSVKRFKNNRPVQNYLLIEITDNGIGIPQKELSHIFHRFYQSQNSNKTEHGGSGIGLSIVKEYIELHQGSVKASSTEGKGTTMKVYLPLGEQHFPASLKKDLSVVDKRKHINELLPEIQETNDNMNVNHENESNHKPYLLIVDDDTDMLSFLSNHFNGKYKIRTALNGKDALSLIKKDTPDLLISDIMMPEIDGVELCDTIKNEVETSHIPVILLTAKAGDDNIIDGYEKGADRYISKPFSLNVLEAQVAQLLSTRRHLIDLYSKKILLKPKDITITSLDEKFLSKLIDIIEDNLGDPDFDVALMVDKMNMSHSAVLKKLKALTNTSLVDFVRRHRLNKAAMIFQQQKIPVSEVAYMVGFSDPKYFSKCFNKQFGRTPSEYVQNPVIEN